MYTLLIGKPPYEAKDVKSTYKRILANMYSFPDHTPVSDRAKNLIRSMLQSKPELRPTLDEVSSHPFFTHADVRIPASLPQSSTQVEPKWRINSKDEIVVDTTSSSSSSENASTGGKSHSDAPEKATSSRRPLSTRSANANANANANPPPESGATKPSAVAAAPQPPPSSSSSSSSNSENKENKQTGKWAFKIYDDYLSSKSEDKSKSKTKPKSTTNNNNNDIADLTAKTAAFSLTEPKFSETKNISSKSSTLKPSSSSTKTATTENADVDMCALETMHQRLSQSFSNTDTLSTANNKIFDEGGKNSAATTWVTRYVDYTSKYGLGFLLNDGSAGGE